jgi:uncharacterized protein
MRYIVLIVLALVVYGFWRQTRRILASPKRRPASEKEESMVACVHCGVHVPESDMVSDAAGRRYCSDEHRKLGARS